MWAPSPTANSPVAHPLSTSETISASTAPGSDAALFSYHGSGPTAHQPEMIPSGAGAGSDELEPRSPTGSEGAQSRTIQPPDLIPLAPSSADNVLSSALVQSASTPPPLDNLDFALARISLTASPGGGEPETIFSAPTRVVWNSTSTGATATVTGTAPRSWSSLFAHSPSPVSTYSPAGQSGVRLGTPLLNQTHAIPGETVVASGQLSPGGPSENWGTTSVPSSLVNPTPTIRVSDLPHAPGATETTLRPGHVQQWASYPPVAKQPPTQRQLSQSTGGLSDIRYAPFGQATTAVTETRNIRWGEELHYHQEPRAAIWQFIPLFKRHKNSAHTDNFWQIGFDGHEHIEVARGRVGTATPTITRRRVELNTSGKNLSAQAYQEARDRFNRKRRKGYLPAEAESTCVAYHEPMKGVVYSPGIIKHWPVVMQPKLDGFRATVQLRRGLDGLPSIYIASFANNEFVSLRHLHAELYEFFKCLPPKAVLDGEMYCHEMSFSEMQSAIKTTTKVHPHVHRLQFWMFDVYFPEDRRPLLYEERYQLLLGAQQEHLSLLPAGMTSQLFVLGSVVVHNEAELIYWRDVFLASEYEGGVAKCVGYAAPHDPKHLHNCIHTSGRGQGWVKIKIKRDEEVLVIGVSNSAGTEEGAAMLVVQDARGFTYNVRMRATLETRRTWLLNPTLVVGKMLTVEYQETGSQGKPRFPVGSKFKAGPTAKAFRDNE